MGKCTGRFKAICTDGKEHEGELLICECFVSYIKEDGKYWGVELRNVEEIGNAGRWDEIKDWAIRGDNAHREALKRLREQEAREKARLARQMIENVDDSDDSPLRIPLANNIYVPDGKE